MGGGGPKIKIGNPIKAVTDTASNIAKEAGKAANNVLREAGKGISKVTELPMNAIKETDKTIRANKEGINATAGLAARGAAAFYTAGASELVGGGNYLTKQFGGAKKTSQYGQTVGTIGGVAGAGAGLNSLAKSGAISKGAASIGSKAAGSVIAQRAGGKEVDAGRTIASVGGSILDQAGEPKGDEQVNWYDDFLDIGKEYAKQQVLGGGSAKNKPQPLPQQPVVIQQPAPQQSSGIDKNILIAGGAVVLLLGVFLITKK